MWSIYQIVWPEAGVKDAELELAEIGPRFVLEIVRIFAGSFGGETLYQNPSFISPNKVCSVHSLGYL